MARGLVLSRPFPTCLRRPYLFPCAGKDRGEKDAWLRLAHIANAIQTSPDFLVGTNTRTHPTGATVRAACYGTQNLQAVTI